MDSAGAGDRFRFEGVQECRERIRCWVHAYMIGEHATVVKAYAPKDRRICYRNLRRMDIGERICRLRGDMSQRELARRSELDAGTISRIERGVIDPTFSTLAKIAKGLGRSLDLVDATQPAIAGETESHLPEGPIAQAVRLLRGEIHEVLEIAKAARQVAEEAKMLAQRRGRKTA